MKKIPRITVLIAVLVIFAITACSSPTHQTASPTSPGSEQPYPNTESESNAYPAPIDESTEFVIEVIPTPSSDTSVVTGFLKLRTGEGVQPANKNLLSLGVVLKNEEGTPTVAQLDLTTSLRTRVDKNGRFVFINVPPGEYVLAIDRLVEAYMLNDPETGSDFIITAIVNQTIDLGELIYDQLPGTAE